ncbi:IPT/TIG domain-containing protein [Poritiphilus flavus]|uniref:IPT/TIG domain-containing protein n=1 Tax=Poritiphilus flavus TaxID=2697053 RepID=A0A6L9E9K3_9FLAO|nr:IPT/TIG domain-containing protein [Poritiphilus flavus]NAS11435.1 hypothetical protein [Poritiphilus flavus]
MKIIEVRSMKRLSILLFSVVFITGISCNKDGTDDNTGPVFSSLPRAVMGEEIEIDGEGFELGRLQVFFDNEESAVNYVTNKKIKVVVPRTLERYNPTVRIVDLNTNENVLEETFLLRTPVVSGFSSAEISFQETLKIQGENFDSNEDFVQVEVNGERADVLRANHNEIDIYLPTAIFKSDLEVKVTAQLQEVVSEVPLQLKEPEILTSSESFWTGGELVLTGMNFNPDMNIGKVFVDDKETTISRASKDELTIRIPVGPYEDFVANKVVYQMGGHEVSLDIQYEILNNSIVVDTNPGINGTKPVVYAGKAYAYFQGDEVDFGYKNNLYQFSADDQKWEIVEGTEFEGYLESLTSNEKGFLYVYSTVADNTRILKKINLADFSAEEIQLPFNDNRYGSVMFYFQDTFYMINGKSYDGNTTSNVATSYQYDELSETWSELSSGPIWEHFKFYSTGLSGIFHFDGIMHYNYSPQSGVTKGYRLNPDLTLDDDSARFYFQYQGAIINQYFYYGGFGNYLNDKPGIEHHLGSAWEIGNFFVLNDNIYFRKGSDDYTRKLKKEILNEIL